MDFICEKNEKVLIFSIDLWTEEKAIYSTEKQQKLRWNNCLSRIKKS